MMKCAIVRVDRLPLPVMKPLKSSGQVAASIAVDLLQKGRRRKRRYQETSNFYQTRSSKEGLKTVSQIEETSRPSAAKRLSLDPTASDLPSFHLSPDLKMIGSRGSRGSEESRLSTSSSSSSKSSERDLSRSTPPHTPVRESARLRSKRQHLTPTSGLKARLHLKRCWANCNACSESTPVSASRSPLAPLECTTPVAVRVSLPVTPVLTPTAMPVSVPPIDTSSPLVSVSVADESPLTGNYRHRQKRRRQRFRLLRTKKIVWEESLSQTSLDLDQSMGLGKQTSLSRATDMRQTILSQAGQTEPMSWEDCLGGMAKENFVFVGEGDFARVYRYRSGKNDIVLKVMPAVRDNDISAPDELKGYSHYSPEIIASQAISELPYKYHNNRTNGFVSLNKFSVLKGQLPEILRTVRQKSMAEDEEDDYFPLESLPDSQEWLVLEYPYVGRSLDTFNLKELPEDVMRSIVAQVALSLAAAEQALELEHRDLHQGNIVIQEVRDKNSKLRFRVAGENYSVVTEGYKATVIDFTLTRLKTEEGIVYMDIADEMDEEMTDDMPDHLIVHFQTKKLNGNNWRDYNPVSNLLWFRQLVKNIVDALNELPIAERWRKRNDECHKAIRSELTVLYESTEKHFSSCSELVRNNFFFDSFRHGAFNS